MRFPVLAYHRITAVAATKFDVTWEKFREQVDWLAETQTTVESLAGLGRRVRAGEQLPARYVVLTFDDGHASDAEVARLLDERGFTATFSIITDRIGALGFLTTPELVAIARRHHIASHSVSHRPLIGLPPAEMRRELRASKEKLEALLVAPCDTVCVPFGATNRRIVAEARAAGYEIVGDSNPAFNTVGDLRAAHVVHRICINRDVGAATFHAIVHGKREAVRAAWARFQLVCLGRALLPAPAFRALRRATGAAAPPVEY